ncbi:unnamed protein product [Cuscuta epithymum]|uniref:Uncharacterized protein n=1 Tax=Cuscuta epithymum TaxID=186058 RepID=A0AAV0DTK7_9ASTE|nr:unnamed protein product [Cuscuta epithymum]
MPINNSCMSTIQTMTRLTDEEYYEISLAHTLVLKTEMGKKGRERERAGDKEEKCDARRVERNVLTDTYICICVCGVYIFQIKIENGN